MRFDIMLYLLSILFLNSIQLQAQTILAPNPSFEDTVAEKPSSKFGRGKNGDVLVKGWYQPTDGTADYYNSDQSHVNGGLAVHKARNGKGRIGLVMDIDSKHLASYNRGYKEYAQAKLLQTLEEGKTYSVNFYVTLDKRSQCITQNIGAYFSNNPVSTGYVYDPLMCTPQILTTDYSVTANCSQWSLVHGYYTAKGGEQYITLGSFGLNHPFVLNQVADNNVVISASGMGPFSYVAYYYIDDVAVYEVSDTINDNYKQIMGTSKAEQPYNNIVLVLDVSSSMAKDHKIKSLKQSVDSLLSTMDSSEIISITTFDASPKVLARHIRASQKNYIISKIDSLKTGGGTNVNTAVQQAYNLLDSAYIPNGNNKVILITDAGYQLSKHSRSIIEQHSKEKKAGFSTLIFNDVKYRSIKKVCRKNKGSCNNVDASTSFDALDLQLADRPIDDYTHENKGRVIMGKIGRASLVVLLIGLLALKYVK